VLTNAMIDTINADMHAAQATLDAALTAHQAIPARLPLAEVNPGQQVLDTEVGWPGGLALKNNPGVRWGLWSRFPLLDLGVFRVGACLGRSDSTSDILSRSRFW